MDKTNFEWIFHETEKFEIDISELCREDKIVKYNDISIKDEYKCSFSDEFIEDSTKILIIKGEWTLDEIEVK